MNNDSRDPWGARPAAPTVPERTSPAPAPVVPQPQPPQRIPMPVQPESQPQSAANPVVAGLRSLQPVDEAALLRDLAAQKSQDLALTAPVTEQEENIPDGIQSWTPTDQPTVHAISADPQVSLSPRAPAEEPNKLIEVNENTFKLNWIRMIIAGISIPIVWIGVIAGGMYVSTMMSTGQASVSVGNSSSAVFDLRYALLFVQIAVAAIPTYLLIRYSSNGYRLLIALGASYFAVTFTQLLPMFEIFKEHITLTSVLVIRVRYFYNDIFEATASVPVLLTTVGVFMLAGIVGVVVLCVIVKFLRFRLPAFIIVVLLLAVALSPSIVAMPLIAAERAEQERVMQELYRIAPSSLRQYSE